jgi:hypothetical protein
MFLNRITRLQPIDPSKPLNFRRRLKEIDMFFNRTDPVHQTMYRLVRRLEKAKIPYAIVGAMAVNAHNYRRTTDDVDILLTAEGLAQFRERLLGKHYDPLPGRNRRFVERKSLVTVDVLVTGLFPGSGKPGPIAYPAPEAVSEKIDKMNVVDLVTLVQLKLAAHRHKDFGDVVELIRVHSLDEDFAKRLHPSVRRDYIECLEEKRREEEYEAREG